MPGINSFVELYKKIKKSKGWTEYRMGKELGISQTQYEHYEEKPISTREIILVRLFEASGLPLDEFWELFSKEAKEAFKKKMKAKLSDI